MNFNSIKTTLLIASMCGLLAGCGGGGVHWDPAAGGGAGGWRPDGAGSQGSFDAAMAKSRENMKKTEKLERAVRYDREMKYYAYSSKLGANNKKFKQLNPVERYTNVTLLYNGHSELTLWPNGTAKLVTRDQYKFGKDYLKEFHDFRVGSFSGTYEVRGNMIHTSFGFPTIGSIEQFLVVQGEDISGESFLFQEHKCISSHCPDGRGAPVRRFKIIASDYRRRG